MLKKHSSDYALEFMNPPPKKNPSETIERLSTQTHFFEVKNELSEPGETVMALTLIGKRGRCQ